MSTITTWILLITLWSNTGATSQQIGPYTSKEFCQDAKQAFTMQQQTDLHDIDPDILAPYAWAVCVGIPAPAKSQ